MAFQDTTRQAADRLTDWLLVGSMTTAPLWTQWLEFGLSMLSMLAGLVWIGLKIRRELRDSPPKSD